MPCKEEGHNHVWNTTGILVIERCETICQFCAEKGIYKAWEYAWFLRRHVRTVHCDRDYKNLWVIKGWSGALEGNKQSPEKQSASRKGRKACKRATSPTRTAQVTQMPLPQFTPPTPPAAEVMQGTPFSYPQYITPPGQANQVPVPDFFTPTQEATLALLPAVQHFTPPEEAGVFDLSNLQDFDFGATTAQLDPSIVLDGEAAYDSDSPWTTPQSVRTNEQFILASVPMTCEGPETLVAMLNYHLRQSIAHGDFTENEALFVLEHYTEAFRAGREL